MIYVSDMRTLCDEIERRRAQAGIIRTRSRKLLTKLRAANDRIKELEYQLQKATEENLQIRGASIGTPR